MIASKQIAFGKAAGKVLSAKSYIQDGLVAMWDGIENAGWGKHDPSATEWKDLMGGDSFVFKEVHKYAFGDNYLTREAGTSCASRSPMSIFQSAKPTIEACFSYYHSDFSSGYIFGLVGDAYSFGLNWKKESDIPFSRSSGVHNFKRSGLGTHSLAAVYTDEVYAEGKRWYYRYFDGEHQVNADYPDSASFTSLPMYLMRVGGAGTTYNLKVHSIRLYSRALTAEEIAHNYEIDKARFGL